MPNQLATASPVRYRLNRPEVTLSHLLSGAEQIAQRLRTLSSTIGPASQAAYFYTACRAKSADSIREKIFRKQRNPDPRYRDENYSFRQLTDAVGFRVVTLYDVDLLTAIDYIHGIIVSGQHLPEPLFAAGFVWALFQEGLFIKRSNDPTDPYARCLHYLTEKITTACTDPVHSLNTFLAQCRDETRDENRYSSAHLIFRGIAYVGGFALEIPVEFQLRTAVEDIWAEINHKLLYKSNTSFTWSHRYASYFNASKKASTTLKDMINDLSPAIGEFYLRSKEAANALEHFWETEGPEGPEGRKGHGFHFSLCTSLFFAMGDLNAIYFVEQFRKYRAQVHSLKEAQRTKDTLLAHAHIKESIDILNGIITDLRLQKERLTDPSFSFQMDAQLYDERIALCELEQLRLRSFMAISFGQILSDDASRSEPAGDPGLYKNYLKSLYGEFCRYIERPLSLRPICMITFFKHLLSMNFNRDLARKNLSQCYQYIDSDKTLPPWSIYFVLLPRMSASFQLSEIKSMIGDVAKDDPSFISMKNFRFDIQSQLIEALNFALRAFRVYRRGVENYDAIALKRGDIIFGFEKDEHIKDITIIFQVCILYITHFDNLKKRLLPAEID